MRHGKLNALGVLLAAALVPTGCGLADDPVPETRAAGGPPAAATVEERAAAARTCDLLAAADLKGLLGKAPAEPEPRDIGPYQGCEYTASGAPLYLHLGVRKAYVSGAADFEKEREARKDPKPVSGVGAEAFSATTSLPAKTEVVFVVDDQVVTVSLVYYGERTGDPAADVDRVAGLAEKAFARL